MSIRSLIKQFSQIRGAQTYDDTLDLSYSEQTGRSYLTGSLTVTSGSATVTDASNVFSDSEKNNFIVISAGDAAGIYTISSANGTNDCDITPTPTADFSGSYSRHYFKNLEDDLNYIRSQLKQITGEGDWQSTPATDLATLSGINIGLEPYEDTRVVFQNENGLTDSADFTFDDTNKILTTLGTFSGYHLDLNEDDLTEWAGSGVYNSTLGGVIVDESTYNNTTVGSTLYNSSTGQYDTIYNKSNIQGVGYILALYYGAGFSNGAVSFTVREPIFNITSSGTLATKYYLPGYTFNENLTNNFTTFNEDLFVINSSALIQATNNSQLNEYQNTINPLWVRSIKLMNETELGNGSWDNWYSYGGYFQAAPGAGGTAGPYTTASGTTVGLYSGAYNDPGTNIGGWFYAYNSRSDGAKSDAVYAIKSYAYSNSGYADVAYGIYAEAETADVNWAGYFAKGDVMIKENLQFGADSTSVSGITTLISSPGLDDRLATEQAIVELVGSEITSISGIFVDDSYIQVVDDGVNPGYIEMVADGTQVSYWDSQASTIRLGKQTSAGKIEISDTTLDLSVGATNVLSTTASGQRIGVDSNTYINLNTDTYAVDIYSDDFKVGSFSSWDGVSIPISDITLGDGESATTQIGIASITDTTGNISTTLSQVGLPDSGGSYIVEDSSAGMKFTASSVNDANYLAFESSTGTEVFRVDSSGLTLASGVDITEFSSDGTFAHNSDDAVPTEKAVKTYVDGSVSGLASETYVDTAVIWEIVDTPTTQIRPKVAHLDKAIYTEGDVTIGGNLTVTGTLFYTDTETVQVADNIMVLNYGEPGAGVTAGEAGIAIDRGSETDYHFVFDEGTDTFRVGVSGTQDDFNDTTLQPVATREDTPIDTRVPYWNSYSNTFRTQGTDYITVNSGTNTTEIYSDDFKVASFSVNDGVSIPISDITLGNSESANIQIGTVTITDTTGNISSTLSQAGFPSTGGSYVVEDSNAGAKFTVSSEDAANYLAFEASTGVEELRIDSNGLSLNAGASVNEILSSSDDINASSTDDQLATAKLIYNELEAVTTGSGSIDHNLLGGLQGGAADEYYHLTYSDYLTVGHSHPYASDSHTHAHSELTGWNGSVDGYHVSENVYNSMSSDGSTLTVSDNLTVASGTFGLASGTTVNEITTTVDGGSTDDQLPTALAVYNEVNAVETHTHYDVDMTYDSGDTWYYDGSFSTTPSGLVIYVNGVKNRSNDSDYYTTTVSGGVLYVEFAYSTTVADWVNMEYIVYS